MEERKFKGIWIPKEIWTTDELTLQEKVMLVEIDSLDDEEHGCYASNKYFSNFFKLTTQRVSQIINSLSDKGFIKISYEYQGKEIDKRILKINRPPYPEIEVSNRFDTYQENDNTGYQEKFKDNNTSINNKENIYIKEYYSNKELNDTFLEFLEVRKKKKAVNTPRAITMLINKLSNYDDKTKLELINRSIINSWKDIYVTNNKETTLTKKYNDLN